MTVGIVAAFRWWYGENDVGWALLGMSDRMLTSSDVEYEPPQSKLCALGKRAMLLTAGSVHVHSEAARATLEQLSSIEKGDVKSLAATYAEHIRDLRARLASQEYLSPLGLEAETFLIKQRHMEPSLVSSLANKLSNYRFDTEAIICGMDDDGSAEIYHVDGMGIATCHSDAGFMAIGMGAGHANVQLMASGYSRYAFEYYSALATLYFAKKSAEVAPGVGKSTDIFLITRAGWEIIIPQTHEMLQKVYERWAIERNRVTQMATAEISEYFANQSGNTKMPETPYGEEKTDPDKPQGVTDL